MIKTAAIFPRFSAQNSKPVLSAISQSLEKQGISVEEHSLDADVAVIWSVLWAGRMKGNQDVYHHYLQSGRRVIVAEIGSLVRGHTWKIALDNVNANGWFGDGAQDPDRPAKLGLCLNLEPAWPEIVIAAQHRHSQQALSISAMEEWTMAQVQSLREHTDRPIVIRPHPRDPLHIKDLPKNVILQLPQKVPGTYDSFDWHNRWHAVVNYNSGPGILAGIAGVRPVVHASSLAWPVAVNMQDIEKHYDVDRESWLIDLSHTEYTLEEIEQGLWLKRLWPKL